MAGLHCSRRPRKALDVIKKYKLLDAFPSIVAHIDRQLGSAVAHPDAAASPVVIAKGNRHFQEALARQGRAEGMATCRIRRPLTGLTEQEATMIADFLRSVSAPDGPSDRIATALREKEFEDLDSAVGWVRGHLKRKNLTLVVLGGEPRVELTGIGTPEQRGKGGRTTDLVLRVSREQGSADKALMVGIASDGNDGTSESAGCVAALRKVSQRGRERIDLALRRFDSASYFEREGDLLVTGRTGTNVNDAYLILFSAR